MTEAPKRLWPLALGALCILAAPWTLASDATDQNATDLAAHLQALDIGLAVKSVKHSKIPGLYEVSTDRGLLYVSEDGNYLLAGSLYEVQGSGLVNLTEQVLDRQRRELFATVDESDLIIFTPEEGAKASVMVFTDTDCGFCRQLHGEMPNYLALGIEVRYLAFPRAGVGSDSYDRMVSAWCADDSNRALTSLKRGQGIPEQYCETHPVGEQFELGQLIGITGTPAIVLPSGRVLPGYVPPDDLAAVLGL